jgi:drug/metabolite transporter (DMT)-like permease
VHVDRQQKIGGAVAMVTAIIFGAYPAAVRGVYESGGNAVFMVIASTVTRALLLSGYCLVTGKGLFRSRQDTEKALVGGFFQAISVLGIFAGLVFLPGPLVLIIVFTHTLMLLFFMAWRREIILDSLNLGTAIAALVGLSMVLDIWHSQPQTNLIGMAASFIAALATVSRLYVYGHQTKTRSPAVVGAESFVIASLFTVLAAAIQIPHMPGTSQGFLFAVIACCSLSLGTFGMFYGISLLGSFQWSLFSKLEPVFTAIFSTLLLHEMLKPYQYAGMFIVIISLILYQFREYNSRNSKT